MKKLIILILNFFLVPSLTFAATKCINADGSNGCLQTAQTIGESVVTQYNNFIRNLSNGDTIKLESDIDTFTFESNNDALNITIDLNGHTINKMTLYGTWHYYNSWWQPDSGEVTYTIKDTSSIPKTGRINKLTIGETRSSNYGIISRKVNANIQGILFEPGNSIDVEENGVLNIINSRYGEETDKDTVHARFIRNDGAVNIKSGTYYGCMVANFSTSGEFIIGDPSSEVKLYMYGSIINNYYIMKITSGYFKDMNNDDTSYDFIYNSSGANLYITGGSYTLSKKHFIHNMGIAILEGTTENPIAVSSSARLFNQSEGSMTIKNGTYKTTTSDEAFYFYGGTINFNNGTIEAKNAASGYNNGVFNFGSGTPTNTSPVLDLRKGELTNRSLIKFQSGIMYLHRRIDRFTSVKPVPYSGYYLSYTPVSNSYYKLSLSTTDTESTNPQYITGDLPEYLVSFDKDGGNGNYPDQIVKKGEKAQRPSNNPIKTDYFFNGWLLNDTPFEFENTPITSDITLKADWRKKFTIYFNTNGGSEMDEAQYGEGWTFYQTNHIPTKEGYAFGGWYLNNTLETMCDLSFEIDGDKFLYAKWYLQYDWNNDEEFALSDIYFYRQYLSGANSNVEDQYNGFDYFRKKALNNDDNTEITVLDLVQARIALASKSKN